jgi:hypothetical protein
MRHRPLLSGILALAIPVGSAFAGADLGGSRASIRHQHEVAKDAELTFLKTVGQVREFVAKERLELVQSTNVLTVSRVSFPYTRSIVKQFIERLAAQYHAATGEKLVITSLVRPTSRQPRNASPYSVHPAGIAVDFRVPSAPANRFWLEATLLMLESEGVLDVTRERRPPHYHVAVFPEQYATYLAARLAKETPETTTPVGATAQTSVERAIESVGAMSAALPAEPGDYHPSIALIAATAGLALTLGAGGLLLRRN